MAMTYPVTPQTIRFTNMDVSSPQRPPISPITPRICRQPATRSVNRAASPSPLSRKRKHDACGSSSSTSHPAPTPSASNSAAPPPAKKLKVQDTGSNSFVYPGPQSRARYVLNFLLPASNKSMPDFLADYWRRDEPFADFCKYSLQKYCWDFLSSSTDQEKKDAWAWALERQMEAAGGLREFFEAYFVTEQQGLKTLAEGIEVVFQEQKARKWKKWDEEGRIEREGTEKLERRKAWGREWEERHEENDPACQFEVASMDASDKEHERAKNKAMWRWTDEKEKEFQRQLKAKKTQKERDAEDEAARQARYYAGEATKEDEVLCTAETRGTKRQTKMPKRYMC